MEYTIIGLLSLSIILLIVSFFKKDKVKEIEEQVDQLSLTLMQESYQLKKKIKVLEEELLINDQDLGKRLDPIPPAPIAQTDQDMLLAQYDKGLSYEQIAKGSTLPTEEVRLLVERAKRQNKNYDH
ncbi:hypothetical protein PY093_10640 [Cytobacillus sp. S13-E01]|uniref:hypothetical protein n=1 Tax=Cytobacillus sp. S13-E01 TaxID=3031326 RepID=UPI0023D88241|nr:hypothetical protein [Cytobacillus sp. S13-E01]MDF0727171.1 hypothetical protein [Cytobacillus sp. S13-E01]